jgi:hypothetical protein
VQPEEPSHDTFVIHAANESSSHDLKKRLNQFGSIEVISGPTNGVILRLPHAEEKPRYNWQAIRDLVGENVGVHPVLLDSGGGSHYPTGRITVRFQSPPNEAEVEQFARTHNLETKSKNKFIPSQFIFEPRESAKRYLPDVLDQVRAEGSVKAAWADTLSQYERV